MGIDRIMKNNKGYFKVVLAIVFVLLISIAVPAQAYYITLTVNPSKQCPGESVSIVATLRNSSTNQGVGGANACIDVYFAGNKIDGACYTTTSSGTFSLITSKTSSMGGYTVRAESYAPYAAIKTSSFEIVTAPFVHIGSETYYGIVSQVVEFQGTVLSGGKPGYSWYWTFGDGNTSTKQNPEHIYAASGTYNVRLKVTDACGKSGTDAAEAIIVDELTVDANGPYMGKINEPVEFLGSANGGYPPYTWNWDFGDGDTSYEQNPMHEYQSLGEYTVTLTVTDDQDNSVDDITTANILDNDPPNAPTITGTTSGKIGKEYEFTFVTTDPDGDDVYYWIHWGEGCTYLDWVGPYASGQEVKFNNSWPDKGDYNITAKAKDIYDQESDWGTLDISMPKNNIFLLQRIINFITQLRSTNLFKVITYLNDLY